MKTTAEMLQSWDLISPQLRQGGVTMVMKLDNNRTVDTEIFETKLIKLIDNKIGDPSWVFNFFILVSTNFPSQYICDRFSWPVVQIGDGPSMSLLVDKLRFSCGQLVQYKQPPAHYIGQLMDDVAAGKDSDRTIVCFLSLTPAILAELASRAGSWHIFHLYNRGTLARTLPEVDSYGKGDRKNRFILVNPCMAETAAGLSWLGVKHVILSNTGPAPVPYDEMMVVDHEAKLSQAAILRQAALCYKSNFKRAKLHSNFDVDAFMNAARGFPRASSTSTSACEFIYRIALEFPNVAVHHVTDISVHTPQIWAAVRTLLRLDCIRHGTVSFGTSFVVPDHWARKIGVFFAVGQRLNIPLPFEVACMLAKLHDNAAAQHSEAVKRVVIGLAAVMAATLIPEPGSAGLLRFSGSRPVYAGGMRRHRQLERICTGPAKARFYRGAAWLNLGVWDAVRVATGNFEDAEALNEIRLGKVRAVGRRTGVHIDMRLAEAVKLLVDAILPCFGLGPAHEPLPYITAEEDAAINDIMAFSWMKNLVFCKNIQGTDTVVLARASRIAMCMNKRDLIHMSLLHAQAAINDRDGFFAFYQSLSFVQDDDGQVIRAENLTKVGWDAVQELPGASDDVAI
ncbi:hypothetical protein CTRI78_v006160 [Colletotrichum trifolii]|uniref:Uncharacterized protein n=1 Tax=Colletotrichum trifolii TaxID=5466 RepID=A0A4V3HW22_COLTR|nr:hypothetical protein CTRI78_v006160 [Colletotrichum trifolii]